MTVSLLKLKRLLKGGEREYQKTVQERLRYLSDCGLSQAELSLLLCVDRTTINSWLSGRRIPRGNQTHRLLDFIENELSVRRERND